MENITIVRENLGIALDFDQAADKLRVPEELREEFRDIFDECAEIANPKFMYGKRAVEHDGIVTYVGVSAFRSRMMQVNFEKIAEAWPYVATCGREIYDLACSKDDPLERYWVDEISEQYLHHAAAMLMEEVKRESGLENLYSMNPGSLEDFPISCQTQLFDALGGVTEKAGVWLTESFLMMPYKSVSGIYFESDKSFVNCAFCPRENCPNRRAPYDEMQLGARYDLGPACANGK